MNKVILVVKHSQFEVFQEYFKENDISEVLHLTGKATKKNFFLDLFNLSDEERSLFLLNIKTTPLNKLISFCESVLVDKNTGMLIKLKGEKEGMKEQKGKKEQKLVITVITAGFTELVMDSAKAFGITGATILNAKSCGINYSSFLGMGLDSEREIILIACDSTKAKSLKSAITKAILKAQTPKGVSFIMPISDFIHFDDKLKKLVAKKEKENKDKENKDNKE